MTTPRAGFDREAVSPAPRDEARDPDREAMVGQIRAALVAGGAEAVYSLGFAYGAANEAKRNAALAAAPRADPERITWEQAAEMFEKEAWRHGAANVSGLYLAARLMREPLRSLVAAARAPGGAE